MTSNLALTLFVLGVLMAVMVIMILIAPNDLPPKENQEKGRSRGQSA